MKTKEFEDLDYDTRDRLASEYLFKEGKKIYDCVNRGNDTKKCFSFKKDVMPAQGIRAWSLEVRWVLGSTWSVWARASRGEA